MLPSRKREVMSCPLIWLKPSIESCEMMKALPRCSTHSMLLSFSLMSMSVPESWLSSVHKMGLTRIRIVESAMR